MLNILGRSQRVCSGLSRRELMQIGGAGLLGASLPKLLASEKGRSEAAAPPRAKAVIFLYLFGGPSQLVSFDMKPDAPSTIRGPYQPITARTSDLRICEHLPRVAQVSDQFCVIRTMSHTHNDHNAAHLIQTGHPWPRVAANGQDVNASEKDWPCMGSVVEYLDQRAAGSQLAPFPSYCFLPFRLGKLQGYDRTGQYAGWLGRAYNGLASDIRNRFRSDNPYLRECTDAELDFRIQGLVSETEVPLDRLNRRAGLLDQFDDWRRGIDESSRLQAYNGIREQALALLTSDKIRTALDIRREPAKVRDRFGRHLFGQSTLMARRMIEAGARFVTVCWDGATGTDGWDTHFNGPDLGKHLLPKFDQTYSALLEDLTERGLLQDTLVVCLGEMGRTPRATTATWGRDHWSFCFPALIAGAGVRGGTIIGRSDKDAAYPLERRVTPQDLARTIYQSMGISDHELVYDTLGRPLPVMDDGQPISELFA
ncbi:MAG: DUF1501 domain-containing protein [Planctomycetota bacterium]